MKMRILTLVVIALTILLAMYTMLLINLDTSYFGKWFWIQYTSFHLTYILPFLIIFAFFKRLTTIVSGILITIMLLCLTYGFYSLGFESMVFSYWPLTLGFIVAATSLSLLIYFDKKEKSKIFDGKK